MSDILCKTPDILYRLIHQTLQYSTLCCPSQLQYFFQAFKLAWHSQAGHQKPFISIAIYAIASQCLCTLRQKLSSTPACFRVLSITCLALNKTDSNFVSTYIVLLATSQCKLTLLSEVPEFSDYFIWEFVEGGRIFKKILNIFSTFF